MQIFIHSLSNEIITVNANACDKVGDVIDVPVNAVLSHAGRMVDVDHTFEDYDIQNESTINMSMRVFGGAQLGKAVKGRSKETKEKKEKGVEQTEEEKQLQERIRRMELNDYQKKLAATANAQLKEWMAREQKNSRMNKLKIQNQWRKLMRLAKVESLRKDIEILSQNHERDVDRKDAIIQMLDRDLEEAEEQFQMALRSHLLNVDRLIDLQDARLLSLENEFEKDLRIIENEFKVEKDKIVKQHMMEKNELLDIMQAVEAEERDREVEAKQEHEQLREEIRNKNLEDINVLRITLDGNIEELEQHFETAHLNYLQNTDQRTQDFKYLTAKDQDLSKDIEVKIRKIERLQSSLAHWRTKIAQNVRECAERNQALQEEKEALSRHFQELKGKMNAFREHQSRRLKELAQNARVTQSTLRKNIEQSERIIKLGELARKRETEREKILPFYQSSLEDEQKAQDETIAASGGKVSEERQSHSTTEPYQPHAEDAHGTHVQEWEYLDNFWKRYNKVLLDDIVIQKEKERLEKENQDLQSILKQYLDGISVNAEVMDANNPLLVVNGQIQLNNPQRGPPQNVVLDANQIVRTYQMSRS